MRGVGWGCDMGHDPIEVIITQDNNPFSSIPQYFVTKIISLA